MKVGYIRDARQDESRIYEQKKILSHYNLDKIIVERTGDDLDTLLQSLQPGDELHVVSIDRLTRSVSKLQTITNDLNDKNVIIYEKGTPLKIMINPLFFMDNETT